MFYNNKKKVIPLNISDYLTPLALAIWIMDDGTWKKPGVRIATNSFTLEEVELLKLTLENKFNIKSSLHKNNKQYQLYIKGESIALSPRRPRRSSKKTPGGAYQRRVVTVRALIRVFYEDLQLVPPRDHN